MRTGVFLVFLGLAALHLRIAMQEQAEYSGTGDSEAMIAHLRSPFLLTWHARRLHLLQGRFHLRRRQGALQCLARLRDAPAAGKPAWRFAQQQAA